MYGDRKMCGCIDFHKETGLNTAWFRACTPRPIKVREVSQMAEMAADLIQCELLIGYRQRARGMNKQNLARRVRARSCAARRAQMSRTSAPARGRQGGDAASAYMRRSRWGRTNSSFIHPAIVHKSRVCINIATSRARRGAPYSVGPGPHWCGPTLRGP